MGMQLGNSTRTAAPKMREGKKQGRNRKAFSTFYTNHASTGGTSRIRIGASDIIVGVISARKGFEYCKFTADDGSIVNRKLNLRNITADSVSKGAHLLTFSS